MKTIGMEQTTFARCVEDAQREQVIVTRAGKPVAVVIGLEGRDEEQLALGNDDAFWKLIAARRKQGTLTQAELDEAIAVLNSKPAKLTKKSKQRSTTNL